MPDFAAQLEARATALIPTVATMGAARLDGPELLELFGIVVAALQALGSLSAGAEFYLEARAPQPADGADGDGWLNTLTGDVSKKVNGVWSQRGNLKGAPGAASTVPGPRGNDSTVPGPAGKSAYQLWLEAGNTGTVATFLASSRGTDGEDGRDGSRITASANAPTGGTDGDFHYQLLGAERYRVYGNTAGTWSVLYTTPETVSLFGFPASELAKVINPMNWDTEGGYVGPALSGISHPRFDTYESSSSSIPTVMFWTTADNRVRRSIAI